MTSPVLLSNRHRLRVIYGDTDMMGIVYYANYFRFFEAGRNELLRTAGLTYKDLEESGFALPVVDARARYHAPARYDDALSLETSLVEVRFSSLRITYRLMLEPSVDPRPIVGQAGDESLIATGETRHACVGPDGRVVRLPAPFLEKLGVSR
jgi:acyl-CoA thioester hydrolase